MAGCTQFINADLIAAGLSPLAPERELLTASRLFLREIEERIEVREDFALKPPWLDASTCGWSSSCIPTVGGWC